MKFTFNMLLGHIDENYEVIVSHTSVQESGFTKIRLIADDAMIFSDDDSTLYVADFSSLNLDIPRKCMPSYLCICTDSLNEAHEALAKIPETASWVAVKSDSATILLNDLLDWSDRMTRWNQRARLIVARGESMQELLDDSETTIGLPIAVCGPLFDDFVFTKTLSADDPFFNEFSHSGSLSSKSVRKLEEMNVFGNAVQDRRVKVFEPNETIRSWHMNRCFRSNGEQVFFVTAWCLRGEPSPGTIELFDMLAQFAYQLHRSQSNRHNDAIIAGQREQALHDLLSDGNLTQETIDETFLKIGVSKEGLWRIAVVKFDGIGDVPKVFHAYSLQKQDRRSLACVLGDEIVALLPAENACAESLDSVKHFANQHHGKLGISSTIDDLIEVQIAHKQALFAIRIGTHVSQERILEHLCGIEKDYPSNVFFFDDYLFHELIDHQPLGAHGVNLSKKPIYDLVAYDQKHDTQKVRFLYTYMECNGSTGAIARRMGIHRNSVGYQVKSIESILGVNMHDLGFLCHARLAFASIETLGF